MKQGNIFEGDSAAAQLAGIVYRQLMTHRWLCHRDFMTEYMGRRTVPDKLSQCENYGDALEVMSPLDLRDKIADCVSRMKNRYDLDL